MKLRQPLLLIIIILTLSVQVSTAFSLLGPFAPWQTQRIGYQINGQIGGPMALGEEYRHNVRTLTYGFTPEFMDWFGNTAVEEIKEVIEYFNDIGDLTLVDPNSFPLYSTRFNATAFQLNLVDLKSSAFFLITEFLGLTDPSQFVFTLRELEVIEDPVRRYLVINRNYDPITYQPTPFINGHLHTYTTIFDNDTEAFPIVSTVDPLAEEATTVTSLLTSGSFRGTYLTGLTRDDIGGLKYIYRTDNFNVETLPPGTSFSTGGGPGVTGQNGSSTPWTPILPNLTNQVVTVNTNLVDQGLRPGIGSFNFVQAEYDSSFGEFIPLIVRDTDLVITNGLPVRQTIERVQDISPDLVFSIFDDPLTILAERGGLDFTSFDAISAVTGESGPGAVNVPYFVSLNRREPSWTNFSPFFLSQEEGTQVVRWGSFDGSAEPPTVYPDRNSISFIEQLVSGSTGSGGAWIPVVGAPLTDPNAQNDTGVTTP